MREAAAHCDGQQASPAVHLVGDGGATGATSDMPRFGKAAEKECRVVPVFAVESGTNGAGMSSKEVSKSPGRFTAPWTAAGSVAAVSESGHPGPPLLQLARGLAIAAKDARDGRWGDR